MRKRLLNNDHSTFGVKKRNANIYVLRLLSHSHGGMCMCVCVENFKIAHNKIGKLRFYRNVHVIFVKSYSV